MPFKNPEDKARWRREYAAAHPDKIKEWSEDWARRNPDKVQAAQERAKVKKRKGRPARPRRNLTPEQKKEECRIRARKDGRKKRLLAAIAKKLIDKNILEAEKLIVSKTIPKCKRKYKRKYPHRKAKGRPSKKFLQQYAYRLENRENILAKNKIRYALLTPEQKKERHRASYISRKGKALTTTQRRLRIKANQEYRKRNQKKVFDYHKKWRKENPEATAAMAQRAYERTNKLAKIAIGLGVTI